MSDDRAEDECDLEESEEENARRPDNNAPQADNREPDDEDLDHPIYYFMDDLAGDMANIKIVETYNIHDIREEDQEGNENKDVEEEEETGEDTTDMETDEVSNSAVRYASGLIKGNGEEQSELETGNDTEMDRDDNNDRDDSDEVQEVEPTAYFKIAPFHCDCCNSDWKTYGDLFNHFYKRYPPPGFSFDTSPKYNTWCFGKMYDPILLQLENSFMIRTFDNNNQKALKLPLNAKIIKYVFKPELKIFLNQKPRYPFWRGTNWKLTEIKLKDSTQTNTIFFALPEKSFKDYMHDYKLMVKQTNSRIIREILERLLSYKKYEEFEKLRLEKAMENTEATENIANELLPENIKRKGGVSVECIEWFFENYKIRLDVYKEFLWDAFVGEDNIDQDIPTDEDRNRVLDIYHTLEKTFKEQPGEEGEQLAKHLIMKKKDITRQDIATFFQYVENILDNMDKESANIIQDDNIKKNDTTEKDGIQIARKAVKSEDVGESDNQGDLRKQTDITFENVLNALDEIEADVTNEKMTVKTEIEEEKVQQDEDLHIAAHWVKQNDNVKEDAKTKQETLRNEDARKGVKQEYSMDQVAIKKKEMKSFFASFEKNLAGSKATMRDESRRNKKKLKKQAARERKRKAAASQAELKRRHVVQERNVETGEDMEEEIQQEKEEDIQDEHFQKDDNVAEQRKKADAGKEPIQQKKEVDNQDKQVEEDDTEEEWKPYFDSSDTNLDAHWGALEDEDGTEEEDNLEEQVKTENDVEEEVQQEQVENVPDDITQRFPYNQKLKVVFAEDLQKEGYVYDFLGGVTAADYQKSLQTIETRSNVKEAKEENVKRSDTHKPQQKATHRKFENVRQYKNVEENGNGNDREEEWKPYFESGDESMTAHWGALEDEDGIGDVKEDNNVETGSFQFEEFARRFHNGNQV